MKRTMRATTASVAMAMLLNSVEGFAPTPRLQTWGSSTVMQNQHQHQHRMVMTTPNPLPLVDADILSISKKVEKNVFHKVSTDPKPFFVDLLEKTLGGIPSKRRLNFLAAAFAMALMFMPLPSEAATSGGRMGGSYSRPSQSRSMPSRSSGSGGYNRGYSRGYSTGYYSRPSVTIAPGLGYGYSPLVSPFTPFGGYYGSGGVITYARRPNLFDFIFVGGLIFTVTSVLRNANSDRNPLSPFDRFRSSVSSTLGPGTSVVQLSVAMEVPNRDDPSSILSVLNRLSRTANTDNRVGIQNLTSQVALEILRRRSSIVSASSSYQHFQDSNKAGRDYEAKAIKERSKFERETVSKYGGVDYSPTTSPSTTSLVDGKATLAVITLVLAIDGDSTKIPSNINSLADVEEALRKIASDAKVDDCLQSVEILWTPEERTETLSRRDVLADYPELRSV